MADHQIAATPAADNPRRDVIPCQVLACLSGHLKVHSDPTHLAAIQLTATTEDGETAQVVISMTPDAALAACLEIIWAADKLRRAIDRAGR